VCVRRERKRESERERERREEKRRKREEIRFAPVRHGGRGGGIDGALRFGHAGHT